MKLIYAQISIEKWCRWFGISRQAYYQFEKRLLFHHLSTELVLEEVHRIRALHPRLGARKLHHLLQGFLKEHKIKIGRDNLFKLLANHNLLVKPRKRRAKTTHSYHWFRKYSNLIKGFVPTAINQLWVSDITYWKITTGFVYISLITDAYSHKIVGYHLAESLEAIHSLEALKQAVKTLKDTSYKGIHHSDRGIQYCSYIYVKLLQDNQIRISMTQEGDPRENAIAERVNGILKEEYLLEYQVDNFQEASQLLNRVIKLYNEQRPHLSIGNLTPEEVHQQKEVKFKKLWKNYSPKSTTIVNTYQDNQHPANSDQDFMV